MRFPAVILTVLLASGFASAQTPDEIQIAKVLKDLLLAYKPHPEWEGNKNWGQQKEYTVRSLNRQGPLKWEMQAKQEQKNDGHWQKYKGKAVDPATKLNVVVKDTKAPAPGHITFTLILSGPIEFGFEQQLWKAGVRVYSGETRGNGDVRVALNCEVKTRLDTPPGKHIPDVVAKLTVTAADVSYTNLKVDHTLGLGGDAAKLIGDAAFAFVKAVKPSLEKDLVAKCNAALVKAGDIKEVRVKLDTLFGGKK